MVPWLTRHVPRRWMYTGGCLLYLVGMSLALTGTVWGVALSVMLNAMATATTFVCFNAYVLDYVDRADLGRNQSQVMVYAAAPWAIGPVLGGLMVAARVASSIAAEIGTMKVTEQIDALDRDLLAPRHQPRARPAGAHIVMQRGE